MVRLGHMWLIYCKVWSLAQATVSDLSRSFVKPILTFCNFYYVCWILFSAPGDPIRKLIPSVKFYFTRFYVPFCFLFRGFADCGQLTRRVSSSRGTRWWTGCTCIFLFFISLYFYIFIFFLFVFLIFSCFMFSMWVYVFYPIHLHLWSNYVFWLWSTYSLWFQ